MFVLYMKRDGFKMNRTLLKYAFVLALTTFFLVSCKHDSPNFTYMPDMAYSPSIKAQEEGSMRKPPEGTIAQGHKTYPYKGQPELAGRELRNPLKRTKVVLNRGREMFNVYCIVCHGPYGEGDGNVVPKFPRPPTLQSEKIRDYPDGRLFHIMTEGQNLMPSYATQIKPMDRWAIVHYMRVLYRAKHPSASDLKAAEND